MMYECQEGHGLIGECDVDESGERICPECKDESGEENWVAGVVPMFNGSNTESRRWAVRFGYGSNYQYVQAQTAEEAYSIARDEWEDDDQPVTGITDNEHL